MYFDQPLKYILITVEPADDRHGTTASLGPYGAQVWFRPVNDKKQKNKKGN